MTKLKMHTPDLVADNIEWVAARFPGCITESRNEKGEVVRAVDFDLLRQELSSEIVEGPQERYHLNWPGKREALLAANAPIAKTLRPCREESVDFDTTRNLFIEGDNLDALKLLQETYLNKVKMIYIDPPYNTGRDFVYRDNFSESAGDYRERSGETSDEGERLVANTEANGRFHSTWLSMLWPRLRLARNLLVDGGVVCISIDERELARLLMVCDEVFGHGSLTAVLTWVTKTAPKGVPPLNMVVTNHEYIVCYSKGDFRFSGRPRTTDAFANPDNDPRGLWKADNIKSTLATAKTFTFTDPDTGHSYTNKWAYSPDTIQQMILEGKILFPRTPDGMPRQKKFMSEYKNENVPIVTSLGVFHTETATNRLKEVFGGHKYFDFPKPVDLIRYLVEQCTDSHSGDIVIDLFAGSATTGQAVMEANASDGGSRQFLLVQLDESLSLPENDGELALSTIAEVGKERLRRFQRDDGQLLEKVPQASRGFRVLKVDSSNMKDVYYRPDEATPALLGGHVDNIKDDRTDEDLLFQVLLDWGVDLSLPIAKEEVRGKPVYFVDTNALAACFAAGIDEAFVKDLAARKPLRAVFRDAGYGSDDVKINVEQIFKQLSPGTEVKTL